MYLGTLAFIYIYWHNCGKHLSFFLLVDTLIYIYKKLNVILSFQLGVEGKLKILLESLV
jgi:hypothetical protein